MQVCLATVALPQAQNFGLGAVGHVDDAFIPPVLDDGSADGAHDQPVLAHLQEAQVAARIRPDLYCETVTVHLTR